MRKATAAVIEALQNSRPYRRGNDYVGLGDKSQLLVRLHENLIAILHPAERKLTITAAGWITATTCDRLDAIARVFTDYRVSRRQGDLVVTSPDGSCATYGAHDRIELSFRPE